MEQILPAMNDRFRKVCAIHKFTSLSKSNALAAEN